jgi:sugar diacid utilization regulator
MFSSGSAGMTHAGCRLVSARREGRPLLMPDDLVADAATRPRSNIDARKELSNLKALLALSMLMTARSDEAEILEIAATSLPSLTPCHVLGALLAGTGWWSYAKVGPEAASSIVDQLFDRRGTFELVTDIAPSVYALELGSVDGGFGHLVVATDRALVEREQYSLRAFAQQTAMALANARLRARERSHATEMSAANDKLAASVATLERSTAIHVRLTALVASGGGQQAVADALHELTGLPVVIEDRHGNARACTPGCPDRYHERASVGRAETIRRAIAADGPVRVDDRVVAVANPTDNVIGVIVLWDPERTAQPSDLKALEHAATVLAIDLSRLHAITETELRLGGDLVNDMLAGHPEEESRRHAEALGFDLQAPHRVVVVDGDADRSQDRFFHAVRRAARDHRVGTLIATRSRCVVVIADVEPDWSSFQDAIDTEMGTPSSRVGVGGVCTDLPEYPRSFHDAKIALQVQQDVGGTRIAVFDDLGVYRLLAEVDGSGEVERFVSSYLDPILVYDARRNTDLVRTLATFFRCGGSLAVTAAALHSHRNTLKYRLRRIQEISGHDLANPDTRFHLQLALQARATMDALRRAET